MNNKQNLNSNQDDDKTIVFSSSNKVQDSDNSDKTLISNDSDKTQIQSSPSISSNNTEKPVQDSNDSSDSSNTNSKIDNLKNMNKKSVTSSAAVAAGVVGAGVAGAALGTIYSEEIKDIFSTEGFDAPESPEAEAQTTISENPTNPIIDGVVVGQDINTGQTSNPAVDHSSTYEVSATDVEGNTYSVSFLDINSDGIIDSQTTNIHFVDGSSISYTETGENINPFFSNNSGIASIQDFGGFADFGEGTNSATHIYEVQAGDTLSQIAADNDTSIANIMELNPEISDPNVIYAHQDIVIPNNDNISNPYEGGIGLDNQSVVYGDISIDSNATEGNYDSVDWASFNDDPVVADNSDYDSALSQTDFNDYGSTDSYYEYGNDGLSDFI